MEDGSVFLTDAVNTPFQIFKPFAGYLNLFPRTWASLYEFSGITYLYAPFFYNMGYLFTYLILVLYVWRRIPVSPLQKMLIAFTPVLLPLPGQIHMNLSHTQWILTLNLALLISASPPLLKRDKILDFAILFFAGLTGPFIVALFPVFIFNYYYTERDQRKHFRFLFVTAGILAVIQLAVILMSPRGHIGTELSTLTQLLSMLFNHFSYILVGMNAIDYPSWFKLLFLSIIFLGYFLLIKESLHQFRENKFPLLILAAGILIGFAAMFDFRNAIEHIQPYSNTGRYFLIPASASIWTLLFLNKKKLTLTVIALLTYFSIHTYFFLPKFSMPDKDWPLYSEKIDEGEEVIIPINPEGWYCRVKSKK